MQHTKSGPAMELWCRTVDTLLAKGSSFADALDGANMILQAYKRQNTADQADEAEPAESDQQASSQEPDSPLLIAMRRARMG